MTVKTGDTVVVDFTTHDPSTMAAADADSTPTGKLVVNGADDSATVTITNKATGNYKASVTLPTLAAADQVQIRIAATVGGVADKAVVWGDIADTKRLSGLNDIAATAIVSGGAITTSSGAVSTVTTTTNLTNAPTSGDFTTTMKASITAAVPTVTQIAAAVWAALTTGLTTLGSIGKLLVDRIDAAISSRAAPGAQMDLVDSPNSTARDAIATTVEAHLLDEGDSQMLINAIVGAIGNTNIDEALLVAAIRADIERSGGTLANALAAALAGQTAAELAVTGIADVPTNAELATALDGADDAVLAAIAALNNLSSSGAAAAASAALVAYGAATGTQVAGATTAASAAASSAAAAATSAAAVEGVTDKYATMIVVSGENWQFTADAMQNVPVGENAVDWNDEQKAFILESLTGIQAKTDTLGGASIVVTAPVSGNGDFAVRQGDDYAAADGRALEWTNAAGTWPDLSGATITLHAANAATSTALTDVGTVVTPSGENQKVRIELTAVQTAGLASGKWRFTVVAILTSSEHVVTLVAGTMTVLEHA